jgi:hypothetical protein
VRLLSVRLIATPTIHQGEGVASSAPRNVWSPTCTVASQKQTAKRGRKGIRQMLMTILLVVLVLAVLGGAVGHSRYGYAGWSPAGILVIILLLWFFTGHRV